MYLSLFSQILDPSLVYDDKTERSNFSRADTKNPLLMSPTHIGQDQDEAHIGMVGRARNMSSFVMQQQLVLSQEVIPAVRGEYYSYASVFTEERPLYALMKCKSNKSRLIAEAANLASEVNAIFQFDDGNPRIISIKEADTIGLLGSGMHTEGTFDNIWFATSNFTAEQFAKLRGGKDVDRLVEVCKNMLANQRKFAVELHEELVVAFMTSGGKYGMFLVEEITISSIQIEACHILI